nr:uncharacterized protein LOC112790802 [Arachis hypogaea]
MVKDHTLLPQLLKKRRGSIPFSLSPLLPFFFHSEIRKKLSKKSLTYHHRRKQWHIADVCRTQSRRPSVRPPPILSANCITEHWLRNFSGVVLRKTTLNFRRLVAVVCCCLVAVVCPPLRLKVCGASLVCYGVDEISVKM